VSKAGDGRIRHVGVVVVVVDLHDELQRTTATQNFNSACHRHRRQLRQRLIETWDMKASPLLASAISASRGVPAVMITAHFASSPLVAAVAVAGIALVDALVFGVALPLRVVAAPLTSAAADSIDCRPTDGDAARRRSGQILKTYARFLDKVRQTNKPANNRPRSSTNESIRSTNDDGSSHGNSRRNNCDKDRTMISTLNRQLGKPNRSADFQCSAKHARRSRRRQQRRRFDADDIIIVVVRRASGGRRRSLFVVAHAARQSQRRSRNVAQYG
jgi:hypothetical protein